MTVSESAALPPSGCKNYWQSLEISRDIIETIARLINKNKYNRTSDVNSIENETIIKTVHQALIAPNLIHKKQ